MFIGNSGGIGYIKETPDVITISMTIPTGTVTVEQQGVDSDDWFEYVFDGKTAELNSENTSRSIYSPIKLKITAVGTGVRLSINKPGLSS